MKIGFLGKQNAFALEMLRRLQCEHPEDQFSAWQPGENIGRGTLVDESALLAAVKSGHLYGAGLDVVKNEPVSEGNPLLMEPRILVTPHIAGTTDLMLDGTVNYLGKVLTEFRQGIRSGGIVNEPEDPRVPLRD
jgi:phosphoglycerate dehydrogenase-like enzyme